MTTLIKDPDAVLDYKYRMVEVVWLAISFCSDRRLAAMLDFSAVLARS
jgi:hypothetical protein